MGDRIKVIWPENQPRVEVNGPKVFQSDSLEPDNFAAWFGIPLDRLADRQDHKFERQEIVLDEAPGLGPLAARLHRWIEVGEL